jgi:SH3-like domain-containing protein
MRRRATGLIAIIALLLPPGLLLGAAAAEFRSVGEAGAVLYDAPSAQAKKLFVAHRYYPVEVVVELNQWDKVRDASGDLAWVEKRALSTQRTVIVTVARARVHNAPDSAAPPVFDAEKNVALNVVEIMHGGWVRVAHADGQSGYVLANEVWGI